VQVIFDKDEAWSLMSVITSYVIDRAGLSQEGKQRLRRWRNDREGKGAPAAEVTEAVNAALGGHLAEKTDRVIRQKGRYRRVSESAR
jgi:hypothetical protein